MSKTVRITFSGICVLAPGYPLPSAPAPKKAYVVMPAAPEAEVIQDGAVSRAVSRHRTYLYVPQVNVSTSSLSRSSDFVVFDKRLVTNCNVYLMQRAYMTLSPQGTQPLTYNITSGTIQFSPSDPGSADKSDIRWYADMREILPGTDHLSATCDPRLTTTLPNLAAAVTGVVELTSGVIKANFPCVNPGPQKFVRPDGTSLERLFACEFINEIEYPDTTTEVTMAITSFDGDVEPDVTLQWGTANLIDIRVGHDPLDEVIDIAGNRCFAPAPPGTVDSDFELHYKILANSPAADRPVPIATGGQTRHNGCLGILAS